MFNIHNINRNKYMLDGSLGKNGYDWWWHSFTAKNKKTGEERQFFIEFFIVNPKLSKGEVVYGQLKKGKPTYLMVKCGMWGEEKMQLHRFFPIEKAHIPDARSFQIKVEDCYLDDFRTHGSVEVSEEEAKAHPEWMSDSGSMKWNLRIMKEIAFNVGYGAGSFFRAIKAFEMYWHAEGMKSYFDGTIIANGVEYVAVPKKSYGYSDKNWGRNFTSPWIWLASSNITSKKTGAKLSNSAFDMGGGKPKVYFLPLGRKLLSALYYEGEQLEFNFSKFWTHCKTKYNVVVTNDEIKWHIIQTASGNKIDVNVTCQKKDMILVNYEDPKGRKRHNNLYNGGNGKGYIKLYKKGKFIDELTIENVGCEYGVYGK